MENAYIFISNLEFYFALQTYTQQPTQYINIVYQKHI